jgi:hypothetical protein
VTAGLTFAVPRNLGFHGSEAWMTWAQESLRLNLEGWQAPMGCRTAPAAVAVQSRVVQDQLNLILLGSRRISEASARTAKAAMQKISDRADAASESTLV